jgi:hypothetical protein
MLTVKTGRKSLVNRDLIFIVIAMALGSMVLVSLYMLYVIGNVDTTMATGGLKEEAYQRLHELQLKKNHPLTWGSSSDRKIDKEMDEIFKNSENFLGDD